MCVCVCARASTCCFGVAVAHAHVGLSQAPVVVAWLSLLVLAKQRGMDPSGLSDQEAVLSTGDARMSHDDDPGAHWTAEYLRALLQELGPAGVQARQSGPLRAAAPSLSSDLSEVFGVRCDGVAAGFSGQLMDAEGAADVTAAGDDVNNDDATLLGSQRA